MNAYKLNRALHRDLGYFFIGMCLIYAISGIAINHRQDWNPNYDINKQSYHIEGNISREFITKEKVLEILNAVGEKSSYKSHYFLSQDRLRIFIEGGNVTVDLTTGDCTLETLRRRPLFFEVNKLHYNPGVIWTWFSDAFCVALAFLAISGLFILKGKNGLKWRGTVLGLLGIIIPIILLLMYL